MPGNIPAQGENLIANLILSNADANRGSSLQLGLFTNSSMSNATTLAAITEPTGGGYARKTLVDATWVVTGSGGSYPLQAFQAIGSAFAGAIYGYFIATTGSSPKLLAYEVDPGGAFSMVQNDIYNVTPSISFA